MKFALCNEMYVGWPFTKAFASVREIGYTGIEIAPFTLLPGGEESGAVIDVRDVTPAQRATVRKQAADAGLEMVGLHWLLAKTEGFYLTSPEQSIREKTSEYFRALAQLCHDLGGTVMVLGSPQQRNLLPGVTYVEAEQYAAEVLRAAMPACADCGVTIALEPLGPAEGDFLPTADKGVQLAELVDSPNCRLHLDVKAMSSEQMSIPDILRKHRAWLEHFHANDPNLLGPGMGQMDFQPIFAALKEIDYHGWVSVEVFKYEPSPEAIARESMETMRSLTG
jgi:sugar phosphate isomerase/epimerase